MTKSPPVLIQKIWQRDNHHFSIEWTDGIVKSYHLSSLQAQCPCAGCVELRQSGAKTSPSIHDDLRCKGIRSVGRYALRIDFCTGCSNGIYSYDLLRSLTEAQTLTEKGKAL